MTMARFTTGSVRGIAATMLFAIPHPHPICSRPPLIPDAAHRLYDRVGEFRHKDYPAALAGFRFFLELHGQSHSRPMRNIGWVNASTM